MGFRCARTAAFLYVRWCVLLCVCVRASGCVASRLRQRSDHWFIPPHGILEQLFDTTLIVNFAVDYACLTYCRMVIGRMQHEWSWMGVPILLARDLSGKVFFFVGGMALYYAMCATFNGAFNGSV